MPTDVYQAVRSIALPTVFGWLGIDLSQFKTRKGGSEWYGRCFLHEAKSNTTSLSFTNELWHCFSCQSKGRGAIDLIKVIRQCSFTDAVAFLQDRVSKEPPKQKEPPIEAPVDSDGVLKPFTGKYERYAVPCPWLEVRIPDKVVRERYGVFCYNNPARKSAYSGRVMLPVKSAEGILYGYLGRDVSDRINTTQGQPVAKYLFPKNLPKSRFLFGAHELCTFGQLPLRVCYLVESPFSVLKFASLNLPAVSPFGWSVSEEQCNLLGKLAKGIVYLCDRNKYDSCAAVSHNLARHLWVRSPELPARIDDPEELQTREQVLAL